MGRFTAHAVRDAGPFYSLDSTLAVQFAVVARERNRTLISPGHPVRPFPRDLRERLATTRKDETQRRAESEATSAINCWRGTTCRTRTGSWPCLWTATSLLDFTTKQRPTSFPSDCFGPPHKSMMLVVNRNSCPFHLRTSSFTDPGPFRETAVCVRPLFERGLLQGVQGEVAHRNDRRLNTLVRSNTAHAKRSSQKWICTTTKKNLLFAEKILRKTKCTLYIR